MTETRFMHAQGGSRALTGAVSAVLAVAAGDAAAQEQQQEQPVGLGEVIVTATKRAERLQDVSESIAAFDTASLAARGVQQIDDIVKYIPGMSIAQREPGGTTIVFRGVASSGIQFGAVSSSALYLDEQPITQSGRNPDPRFIDIERVEALRGPQGTLYGASSQSGTLRVITAKPDPSGFDAWTEAQVTSVSEGDIGYDVSAMLNLPIAEDRVSLRLVGFAAEDAGFIDNVLTESQGGTFDNSDVVDEDVNTVETVGRCNTQFSAICGIVLPVASTISSSTSTTRYRRSSSTGGPNAAVTCRRFDAGTGCPRRKRPVSRPQPSGLHTTAPIP